MNYDITISKDEAYVLVNVTQNFTKLIAEQFMKDATELGEKNGIRKMLIDMRGISSLSSVLDKYTYAYKDGKKVGLTHVWQIALLVDQMDEDVRFMETVMKNAGFNCRLFDNQEQTVVWLEE
jgi:hypothetical protein